jgi:hypothetical protein
MWKESSYYIEEYDSHKGQQRTSGQDNKENGKKVLCRALEQTASGVRIRLY